MQQNDPTIEVTRKNQILSSVKIIMPTWNEIGEDNKIYTKIPLLGGLTTYALDEEDADIAVKEAIHCFCLAAEKCGLGLENELKSIGWKELEKHNETSIFNIHSDVVAFELMMETGETKAMQFELT